MKTEFIAQYEHTWRVFERLVNDFDADGWVHTGRGCITPIRLSFHILQGVKYYTQDQSITCLDSGKAFDCDWETAQVGDLPTQSEIVECIQALQGKTGQWLSAMDFAAANEAFPWAGKTNTGLALFLLRHSLWHIGELSSLLNESKNGAVEDHYVKAL